ncbi:hypothetical protein [Gordonia sp. ABSL49_1]|uniref:hypothetical protein n=1 Tax=Gordonia sp. ABSL49_1 TaxID=2920941 RepID=UPI001F0E7E9D|nr:hypothetical protein [Gordonia sp. ABSL49_1]MCH5644437.1 hypothetical protein [Gordonia sp. ABSL49_1]
MTERATELFQRLHLDEAGATPLVGTPSQIWVISTLEIPLRSDNDVYLAVQLSSYALKNQPLAPSHQEGYWAPPFVAYPVPISYSAPTKLNSLKKLVAKAVPRATLKRDIEQLAYRLGLRDITLVKQPAFVEIKMSPRSPGIIKSYIVERFTLSDVSEECLNNLSDSEGLFGYSYLPIDRDIEKSDVTEIFSVSHQRTEMWHLGKPIQSNLEHVITDERSRKQLVSNAITLQFDDFLHRETGIILSCDLARSATAVRRAHSLGGYFGDGTEVAWDVMRRITLVLHQFVARLGTTQVQFAGDGLVAAIPDRKSDGKVDQVALILLAWQEALNKIEQIGRDISEGVNLLGSRLAVHYGTYAFGRTAGPHSVAATFDGEVVTEVVRYEQGLRDCDEGSEEEPRHIGLFSDTLNAELPENWLSTQQSVMNSRVISVRSKEFEGGGVFFQFQPVWESSV